MECTQVEGCWWERSGKTFPCPKDLALPWSCLLAIGLCCGLSGWELACRVPSSLWTSTHVEALRLPHWFGSLLCLHSHPFPLLLLLHQALIPPLEPQLMAPVGSPQASFHPAPSFPRCAPATQRCPSTGTPLPSEWGWWLCLMGAIHLHHCNDRSH